ncbi:type IV secretory system conjugative DNA transfer family protein [Promicromonospora sp. NPDC057138]|uniref:type IV secretory system conjugative DNA transfer family protein n=1 Tax=Promicromonospora sp. NPDC057138 TaxID=3346031 RepID=UPI0036266CD9
MGDDLTDLALIGLGALVGLSVVLRAAGTLAACVTGASQPASGALAGLEVLAHPADPGSVLGADGLHPVAYWVATFLLLAAAGAVAWLIARAVAGMNHRQARSPHHTPGTATRRDVAHAASQRTLLKRSKTLRPSLRKPTPSQVGYQLGTAHGQGVWASVEDSLLVLGPPRSGKGLHMVVNAILDAPGAVVATSTRPDALTVTLKARERVGPVAVFDPQHLAKGLPAGLRWSIVRGCEDPLTAMIRATGLASATGLGGGGTENGGFWEGMTRSALQAMLHAAALDGRTARDLFAWSNSPSAAEDAAAILASHPDAATGWGQSLESIIQADPRTRDSAWMGVKQALACLADPRVLDTVSPAPDESFDPQEFLRNNGTLYLLATGAGSVTSGPLVAAFIEDLVETARHLAAASPGARLDPPLLLALDEIGNLAPLPSLPTLMAEGGGTGLTTMPVLQSLSQARDKWGENAANAIWDAAIVKIVLGGSSSPKDLADFSTLIGERDEFTDTHTRGDHGSRSVQRSVRRVAILPPQAIRMLPFGISLVLLRAAPPIIADLRTWTARPDAAQLTDDRTQVETLLQATAIRARRGGAADPGYGLLPDGILGELTTPHPVSPQDKPPGTPKQVPEQADEPAEAKEHP